MLIFHKKDENFLRHLYIFVNVFQIIYKVEFYLKFGVMQQNADSYTKNISTSGMSKKSQTIRIITNPTILKPSLPREDFRKYTHYCFGYGRSDSTIWNFGNDLSESFRRNKFYRYKINPIYLINIKYETMNIKHL